MVVIEALLDFSIHWLLVGCDWANGGIKTSFPTITQKDVAWLRVEVLFFMTRMIYKTWESYCMYMSRNLPLESHIACMFME